MHPVRKKFNLNVARNQVEQARWALREAANKLTETEDEDLFLAAEMLRDIEVQIANLQNNEMPESL